MASSIKKTKPRKKAKKSKAKKSTRKKMGRPPIVFDLDAVEKLGSLGCTMMEIAAFFDCEITAVERRKRTDENFSRALKRGQGKGHMSLRRLQWKNAHDGNVTMQIWLGKQLLHQRDRFENEMRFTGEVMHTHATQAKEELTTYFDRGDAADQAEEMDPVTH